MSRSAGRSRRFPWLNLPFLVVIVLLVGYGLTIVYSAVRVDADYQYSRQIGGVAVGIICMILMWRFDYRRLSEYTTLFLIVNVVLILSPHIPGLGTDAGMGAKSWIKLGMQIQPGEFAKITVILMDAAVMARYGGRLDDPREYLKALGIMLVPFVCIMTQPDLGTGLVYLCIAAFALVMGGARPKYLLITLAVGIAAIAAVFAIDEVFKSSTGEYKLLKQYQRNRLLVFLDQDGSNTSSSGYNLQQAKIAIGSGGLFGKGYMNGTQTTYGFVPEQSTDFIFCTVGEEWGFFGCLIVIGLYVMLILQILKDAEHSRENFTRIYGYCLASCLFMHLFINIGMTIGLMPVIGIPLPFMSYGGSSLWAFTAMLAIFIALDHQEKKYF